MITNLSNPNEEHDARALVGYLSRFANCWDHGEGRAFVCEAIRSEHRTIQQNIARLLFDLVNGWADDYGAGRWDARNEAALRACHAWRLFVTHTQQDRFPPPLPFI